MPVVKLIIEIDGGMVAGVYTDAPLDQDFEVAYLDRDNGAVDEEASEANAILDALLESPGWRGID